MVGREWATGHAIDANVFGGKHHEGKAWSIRILAWLALGGCLCLQGETLLALRQPLLGVPV